MKMPDLGSDKQNPVIVIVLIVVILAAVFFVANNFIRGGGGEYTPPEDTTMTSPPGVPGPGGPPEGQLLPPSSPPGGIPSGPVSALPPGGQPPMPSGQPAGAPAPPPGALAPGTESRPAPAPAPAAAPVAPPAEAAPGMQAKVVFGSVTVSYPKDWGIDISSSSSKAVFTDRKAFFEVHPPDPKATSAKAIALAALNKSAKGGKILKQAADKVSGYDAYWFAVDHKGRTMRVVGIDGPTRIAVVAYTKSPLFASYRDTFNKMQAAIKFGR